MCELLSKWLKKESITLWTSDIFWQVWVFIQKKCMKCQKIGPPAMVWCTLWKNELIGPYFSKNENMTKRPTKGIFGTMHFWNFKSTQKIAFPAGWCSFALFRSCVWEFGPRVRQPSDGKSWPLFMASQVTGFDVLWLLFMGIFERYCVPRASPHKFQSKSSKSHNQLQVLTKKLWKSSLNRRELFMFCI